MIKHETHEGATPAGGVRSDIIYMDKKGNVVNRTKATWAKIREFDQNGNIIQETRGTLG